MSSSAVSQLLQIAAPRADSKLQQSSSSRDGQFQDLLARASSTAEGKTKSGTEASPVQQSDDSRSDNSEQDASSQYDEAATNSDAPSSAGAETTETDEHSQDDSVELSEAVELVLGAQAVPERTPSIDVAAQPALEASVIDAPSVENFESQSDPESQTTTEQFAKDHRSEPPCEPVQPAF